ncbi:MAG TPA: alpha/beta fold hydrolase [Casimicrobiaceae bacterium]|nr:alpha/beta fold hydrolase [Casimicrobiaceae bacterium]
MVDGTAHALPQIDARNAPLPQYRSPAWLRGGHAQTIWPYLLPRPAVRFRRERIETPDGDFWDFDWLDAPQTSRAPLVALFHGLEGSSDSHYARSLMALLAERRLRGVVAHYRGCSGELNRLPRAYHSGDHEELDAMLGAIRERIPASVPIYAVGVSVGGSVLINWLGRQKEAAGRSVAAAAAVSTPLDLEAAGIAIAKGLNRIYTHNFLSTLKPKSLAMARRFPGLLDDTRIRRARSLRAFDDAVTSLLHGFADATDYWRRASSKPWLANVAVPTLVLNAKNDPFVPRETLPCPEEVSGDVLLVQPEHGGHAGFLTGSFPGRLDWMPRRLLDFFLHRR